MERQLTLLRVQYLGEKIAAAIQQAGINHQQEVKEARQEAWQEYKAKYFDLCGYTSDCATHEKEKNYHENTKGRKHERNRTYWTS
jgi:dTDP-4-amino-4,6-dideoxygalactose transaminase